MASWLRSGGLVCACIAFGCSAAGGGGGGGSSAATSGGAANGGGGVGGSGAGSASGGTTGNGEIGAACSADTDCSVVPGSECFQTIGGGGLPTVTFPNGYCSKGCDPQGQGDECGANAGCTSIGSSGGNLTVQLNMCTAPCSSDEGCRTADGYHCQQILPGIGYCAPP